MSALPASRTRPQLFVIAKAPVPGKAKTRLSPPCTPDQAAEVAAAALADTLEAVAATGARRKGVVLEGAPGRWLSDGLAVVPQGDGDLGERLAAAFADAGAPSFIIGADTPQVTAGLLERALEVMVRPGVDAVLGPTEDGGYWGIGLNEARPEVFSGVPMSHPVTLTAQLDRLSDLGLRTEVLPTLRDVDYWGDAVAVAARSPHTHFGKTVARIADELAAAHT